jgi:hypothetical protein
MLAKAGIPEGSRKPTGLLDSWRPGMTVKQGFRIACHAPADSKPALYAPEPASRGLGFDLFQSLSSQG